MASLDNLLKYLAVSRVAAAVQSVLAVLAAYVVLRYVLNNIVGRIVVPLMAKEFAGERKQRAQRIQTLAGVVRSVANYVLSFIILLVTLDKLGVDTKPFLASASVLGLAIGFGSQKLVRDVTTGFFLLAEDQFDVGDYVAIGAVTGTVEEIGMRTTRIRDDVGKVYILSNGDISQVCNHSAGMMSTFVDVAVAASADLERVRAVVESIGRRLDEEMGENILEPPTVQGITALTAAQVTLRIRCRAEPILHERVQMRVRELLRERFAAEGIALV